MFTLAFAPLHARNSKLTRAQFTAGTAAHTTRLPARRARWQTLGEAALAHAAWWYGDQVADTLWLQLRPQRVDAYLAAHRQEWLARVVGMLVDYELAAPLAEGFTPHWPRADATLTPVQKKWGVANQLPARVSAWVFAGNLPQATGWALVQALFPQATTALVAQRLAVPKAAVARAVQVLCAPFAPLPDAVRVRQTPPATAAVPTPKKSASAPATPAAAPHALVRHVRHRLQAATAHQEVLPLAVNVASLLDSLRNFGRIQSLLLIAPQLTSGGLHELAALIDKAVVVDHAQVTVVCGETLSAAAVADLAELRAAGVRLYTSAKRPLQASVVRVQWQRVSLAVVGTGALSAAAYHTSLTLDTLVIAPQDPYAAWWQELQPWLQGLRLQVPAKSAKRTPLLSQSSEALASFKARVAGLTDADTQQRLQAWLYYQPEAPVAVTLDGVEYFALAFPQYDTVVIDTFTPNNALFYQRHGQVAPLTACRTKQALIAAGAKRAYHTDVPIRQRAQRILQA